MVAGLRDALSEIIEGIPFAKLEYVLEYKKRMNREKDQKDIEMLEGYLENLDK